MATPALIAGIIPLEDLAGLLGVAGHARASDGAGSPTPSPAREHSARPAAPVDAATDDGTRAAAEAPSPEVVKGQGPVASLPDLLQSRRPELELHNGASPDAPPPMAPFEFESPDT